MPLLAPAPTSCRDPPVGIFTVYRMGPWTKSKSGPGVAVGQGFGEMPGIQETIQSSNPCTPVAHLIAPVVALSATMASIWSAGSRHCDGLPPLSWQVFAD